MEGQQIYLPQPSVELLLPRLFDAKVAPGPAAPLLRDAVSKLLQSRSGDKPPEALVTQEVARVGSDAARRFEVLPYLIQVGYQALVAPKRTPAQEAFYQAFNDFYIANQHRNSVGTLKAWLRYTGQTDMALNVVPGVIGNPQPPPPHTLSLLLDKGPPLDGFVPPEDALKTGERGRAAMDRLLAPVMLSNYLDMSGLADEFSPELMPFIKHMTSDVEQAFTAIGFTAAGTVALGAVVGSEVLIHDATKNISTLISALKIAKNDVAKLEKQAGKQVSEFDWTSVSANLQKKLRRRLGDELAEMVLNRVAQGSDDVVKKVTPKVLHRILPKLTGKLATKMLVVVPVLVDLGMVIADEVMKDQFDASLKMAVYQPDLKFDLHTKLTPDKEYTAGLCYSWCREGFNGVGTQCIKAGCPASYSESINLCTAEVISKHSYGRTAGTPLTCAAGKHQDGGLCYPPCASGWSGVATLCYQNCPTGWRNDGLYCKKPSEYGRGAGYPAGQMGRCEADQGRGNCEWSGAIIYPKCKAGFHAVGCCICVPDCPNGWEDIGISCKKPVRGRGVGTALNSCPAGKERNGALCYPTCKEGYIGNGPICWSSCPEGYLDEGALCRFSGKSSIAKETYGRGAGLPPRPGEICTDIDTYNSTRVSALAYLIKWLVADPADRGQLPLPPTSND